LFYTDIYIVKYSILLGKQITNVIYCILLALNIVDFYLNIVHTGAIVDVFKWYTLHWCVYRHIFENWSELDRYAWN